MYYLVMLFIYSFLFFSLFTFIGMNIEIAVKLRPNIEAKIINLVSKIMNFFSFLPEWTWMLVPITMLILTGLMIIVVIMNFCPSLPTSFEAGSCYDFGYLSFLAGAFISGYTAPYMKKLEPRLMKFHARYLLRP